MVLGIPFHVGLMYSTGPAWFISSADKSLPITLVTGLLTSSRMPVFFVMAGILSALVLERRDRTAWLKRRVVRLMIPFCTSALVLSPVVMLVIADQRASLSGTTNLGREVFFLLTHTGYHWIGHLWFLIVLMEMSVLTFVLSPWLPKSRAWVAGRLSNGDGCLGWRMAIIFCAVLIPFRIAAAGTFFLFQDSSSVVFQAAEALELETFLKMLPFFVIGLLMYQQRIMAFHKDKIVLVLAAATLLIYAFSFGHTGNSWRLLGYVSGGIAAPLVCFSMLSLGAARWTRHNAYVRHFKDASFTIYLTHYPICVVIGYFLVASDLNIYASYTLNIALTLALSLLCHEFISRHRTTRLLFNGERGK
jgi:glucan biosynthesis protein C